jgi:hypothetical protein
VLVRKKKGEGGLNWGQRWRMGGSHREAAEAVALGRKPERRRGLRWREPTRWTHRRWRRGEELELGCDREENGEKRERVAAVGSTGQPAMPPPGHRAWAAALSRNRGERRGATDAVRARLTGGAGRSRGPSVSGEVREGEG